MPTEKSLIFFPLLDENLAVALPAPAEPGAWIFAEVIREDGRALEFGRVVATGKASGNPMLSAKFDRVADAGEAKKITARLDAGAEFLPEAQKIADEMRFPIKFIRGAESWGKKRATLVFLAEGRIDFRELVKKLGEKFGKVVRLRQTGARERARESEPALGVCGRRLCCQTHLTGALPAVSPGCARTQQIEHRMDSLLGCCGKLRCCLRFENETYEIALQTLPRLHARVAVAGEPEPGKVIGLDPLAQKVKVLFKNEMGVRIKVAMASEVSPEKSPARR